MRKTLLCSSIIILAMFVLTGCPWGTEATTSDHNEGNATGLYYVDDPGFMDEFFGEAGPAFTTMNIWHEGNNLRAQDDRGIIWNGQTGADIGTTPGAEEDTIVYGGFEAYMETVNQATGLTEWLRGNFWQGVFTETIAVANVDPETGELTIDTTEIRITGLWFEGVYTRSDLSSSTNIRMHTATGRFPGGVDTEE